MKDHDNLWGWSRPLLMAVVLALLVVTFSLSVHAQQYTINWYKVSGGGGMNSTGGIYTVSGTIGQHDATGPLYGGNYQVTGGFWALISVFQTPGAPKLHITESGPTVTVYWQAVPVWILQQNNTVLNTAGWTASGGVTTSGGTNFLNLVSPSGKLFFRLSHP